MTKPRHKVTFADAGRKARNPPDPKYPAGIDIDITNGVLPFCTVVLPYPAPNVGKWVIECSECNSHNVVTAAGRPDDPRSVRLPCRRVLQ